MYLSAFIYVCMYAKTKKLTALDEAGITDAATIKLDFSLFFFFFFWNMS